MKSNTNSENKLFRILKNESFTTKFISWAAGDGIQDKAEQQLYNTILKHAGGDLYVKLLFFITHEVFEIKKAKQLWEAIINHKNSISEKLGRNVEITVATLDYLTHIEKELVNPKLIGEAFIGKITEISSIDPLTKLFNRQYLFIKLEEEIARYKRYHTKFSILMIDIDDFKRINDTHGHQKGDSVLVQISNLFNEAIRDLDICTRFGGEEFLIILPHTKKALAQKLAERIGIENYYADDLKITVSIGLANCPGSAQSAQELVHKADEALYVSKRNGKNRVSFK